MTEKTQALRKDAKVRVQNAEYALEDMEFHANVMLTKVTEARVNIKRAHQMLNDGISFDRVLGYMDAASGEMVVPHHAVSTHLRANNALEQFVNHNIGKDFDDE